MNEIRNEEYNISNQILKNSPISDQEDNVNNRVLQTINHGSVYEAIYVNFITTSDVLRYLLNNEINDEMPEKTRLKLLTAYRIVCVLDRTQLIDDKHFIELTNNETYVAIFTLSYCTYQTNLRIPLNMSSKVVEKIHRIFFKIFNDYRYNPILYYICDVNYEKETFDENDMNNLNNLFQIVDARSLHYISKYETFLSANSIPFIFTDYLDPLEWIQESWDQIQQYLISRCLRLIQDAPLYWKHVAEPLYRKTVLKNINVDNPRIEKHVIEIFETMFPGIFPEKILKASKLYLRLKSVNQKIREYALGFPIHIYSPSEEEVEKALTKLDNIGIDDYCEYRAKINIDILKKDFLDYEMSNDKDTLLETINDYNTINIVCYFANQLDKTYMFLFSRSEFDNLIEENKNPYTGLQLPLLVLEEIKYRNELVKKFNLPSCSTMRDLLIKIQDGEALFEAKRTIIPPPPDHAPPSLEESEDRIFVQYYDDESGVFDVRVVTGVSDIDEDDLEDVLVSLFNEDGLEFVKILDNDEIYEELQNNQFHQMSQIHHRCSNCNEHSLEISISDESD